HLSLAVGPERAAGARARGLAAAAREMGARPLRDAGHAPRASLEAPARHGHELLEHPLPVGPAVRHVPGAAAGGVDRVRAGRVRCTAAATDGGAARPSVRLTRTRSISGRDRLAA